MLGVEDDLLDAEAETDLPIVGEGALLAQLTRARDRSMHSIVATIQAEQDSAIRAPNKGVVTIAGGPGHRQDRRGAAPRGVPALRRPPPLRDRRRAGRRAVGGVHALHRAGAALARARPRSRCARSARSSTASARRGATSRRSPRSRARSRWPRCCAVRRDRRCPTRPREFRVFYRDDVLHLGSRELGAIRRQLLSMGRAQPVDHQGRLDADRRDVAPGDAASARASAPRRTSPRRCAPSDKFLEFAAAWWPVLDAATVLGWLRDPDLLARVARGRPRRRVGAAAREVVGRASCSVDDVALLDELRYLLGDPPIVNTGSVDDEYLAAEDASLQEVFTATDREYAGPRGWTPPTNRVEDDGFAHVLVDEAQDLTPMQWRMVGRRGRSATWTIVGDPAQSSWPVPEPSPPRPATTALGDKPRHDFHLVDQLPQLRGDLRLRRRLRRAGRPRRRPARRGALHRRGPRTSCRSTTSSRRCARAGRAGRLARGHRRDRGAGGPTSAR